MSYDVAVVGAGIVGLATARELQLRDPDTRVVVLEAEDGIGRHQTGHNSGVVHAGIYYAPGTLRARLCVEGARELLAYCDARGIHVDRCGKLIVARSELELPALDELERRGVANGVEGLRRLTADEIPEIEPAAVGVAALHSPETAVVDFGAVARAYADDLLAAGGEIRLGTRVDKPASLGADATVVCAGAGAARLGTARDPRIVPFRGAYRRVTGPEASLVRGMIYPVPDPELPFLGVHLTRHGDELLLGPTALLADPSTLRWRATRRLARRFWRTGLRELGHAVRPASIVREAARYVPALEGASSEAAFSGVRAQAIGADGRLLDDFALERSGSVLHVRNAPSPAATASMALARHIADELAQAS